MPVKPPGPSFLAHSLFVGSRQMAATQTQEKQTKLKPIDDFVFAGFQKRFQQVFNCKCAWINQNDKTKILERIFGQGKPLEYPYAYFEVTSVSANVESYNPNFLARRGLLVNVDSSTSAQTVRILPTNFEVEVTYVTNEFQTVEQGSILAFVRRWLLARRMGYLKFSINYGKFNLNVSLTSSDSLPIPQRGNIGETETSYELKTSTIIHGYVSEPVLGTKGIVNEINLTENLNLPATASDVPTGAAKQTIVNSTYHAFNRS